MAALPVPAIPSSPSPSSRYVPITVIHPSTSPVPTHADIVSAFNDILQSPDNLASVSGMDTSADTKRSDPVTVSTPQRRRKADGSFEQQNRYQNQRPAPVATAAPAPLSSPVAASTPAPRTTTFSTPVIHTDDVDETDDTDVDELVNSGIKTRRVRDPVPVPTKVFRPVLTGPDVINFYVTAAKWRNHMTTIAQLGITILDEVRKDVSTLFVLPLDTADFINKQMRREVIDVKTNDFVDSSDDTVFAIIQYLFRRNTECSSWVNATLQEFRALGRYDHKPIQKASLLTILTEHSVSLNMFARLAALRYYSSSLMNNNVWKSAHADFSAQAERAKCMVYFDTNWPSLDTTPPIGFQYR